MTLIEFATCATLIISVIALWRSIWDKRFDKIDQHLEKLHEEVHAEFKNVYAEFKNVHAEFKNVRTDISEIRERLAFIEASTFFIEVSPDPRRRSEGAKRMWERRRSKQLENKET